MKFLLALLASLVCYSLLPAATPADPQYASQQESDQRININTATIDELLQLPGIGPALAERIVEFRRKHGPFKRPQEIIIVRGMSAKRYRQIAHLIRI